MNFDYRLLFETVREGIAIVQGGRIRICNPYLADMFGISRETMLSKSVQELFHEDDREELLEVLSKCRGEDEPSVRRRLMASPDFYPLLWLELSVTFFLADEEPALMCFFRDISECKTEEYKREAERERFETALKIANEGVWEWNLGSGEVNLNSTWYTMLGYDPDEFSDDLATWKNLVHPDDIEEAEKLQLEYSAKDTPSCITFRMRTKSGEYKWIDSTWQVLERDAKGGPRRMIGMHQEVTERVNAQKALEDSEARFKALSNASSGGIIIHDRGIIIDCNDMLQKITGYTRDELIGMDGLRLISNDMEDLVTKNMSEGNEKPYEVVGVRKNGEKYPLHLEARNIPHLGRMVRVVEFRDFTEVYEARREQHLSKSRLEALWHVSRMIEADYSALCDMMLGEAQSMSSSQYSFFGFVEDGALSLQASSPEVMAECAIDNKNPMIDIHITSLWSRALRSRKPVVINDYGARSGAKRVPQGHVPIHRLLLVPFVHHGRVTAMAAVANKSSNYTDDDASQLSAFINSVMILLDRRRIEEELRANEKKLNMALEQAFMGQWELDLTTLTFTFNEQFYAIYGTDCVREGGFLMTAEQYAESFLYPEDYSVVKEEVGKMFERKYSERAAQVEHRIVRRDGEVRDIVVRFTVLEDEAGRPFKAVGVNQDITQIKQIEDEVASQRRRLSDIIEGTNIGTWEWNVQTGETFFNERWADIIGYTLEEISPTNIDTWMKFCHPEDLEASGDLLNRHFSGELDYYECEARMRHREGHWVWVLDKGRVASWTVDGKPLLMSGTHQDITKRKENEEKIRYLATHDSLTGLPSLRLARDRIEQAVYLAKRKNKLSAIFFIDLDGFKAVNDTLGHDAGDALLIETGQRLKSCVREMDTVARIGGDEFLAVLSEIKCLEDAGKVAEKMLASISEPYPYKQHETRVGASIGIAVWATCLDDVSIDELLRNADAAMYSVKNSGKNGYAFSERVKGKKLPGC